MKTYTIPYQYTVIAYAYVKAESLEDAIEFVETEAKCPVEDVYDPECAIEKIKLSYLEGSFEILHDDIEGLNDSVYSFKQINE